MVWAWEERAEAANINLGGVNTEFIIEIWGSEWEELVSLGELWGHGTDRRALGGTEPDSGKASREVVGKMERGSHMVNWLPSPHFLLSLSTFSAPPHSHTGLPAEAANWTAYVLFLLLMPPGYSRQIALSLATLFNTVATSCMGLFNLPELKMRQNYICSSSVSLATFKCLYNHV